MNAPKKDFPIRNVRLAVRGVRNKCRKEAMHYVDVGDFDATVLDDAEKMAQIESKARTFIDKSFRSVRLAKLHFDVATLTEYPQADGTLLAVRTSALFDASHKVVVLVDGEVRT